MILTLKDEQGKTVGTAASMEEAIYEAWMIQGRCYTNPIITFHNKQGER